MAENLRRCKDCNGVLDVRHIDWACRWCGSPIFADTTVHGCAPSSTGLRVSTNQIDRDESPIVHYTPPGTRLGPLAGLSSRGVDDILVSTSGLMPQRTQEQRSTRLVAAPSVAEGSQCPPTSPPTPEFVTPVSSPQMSAFLGGDMTRLSLGSPGSGAILPTSTRQTTAAQEVEADDRLDMRSALLNRLIPYAQYCWFNSHKPGFTQPKRFMGVSCDICKRDTHPTDHHTSNPDQWLEVWRRKGNGKGKCNKKGCKSPTTHNTEDCGRGEFRDHPDNEPLPAELQYYSARRWPAATKEVPLPRYYYRPKDRQPPGPRDPYVPDEFAEHGLPCGLLDMAKGIYWSLDNAIAMAKGSIKPVTYVAKRHAQRGTIARNLGLPRSEQSENPSETDLDRGFRAW